MRTGQTETKPPHSPHGAGRTLAVTPPPHELAVSGHDRMTLMAISIATVTELVILVIAFVHSFLTEIRS